MCTTTRKVHAPVERNELPRRKLARSSSSSMDAARCRETDFYRYARQFALLTLVTAYLGKHADSSSSERGWATASASSGGPLGFGLYHYFFPGLISSKFLMSTFVVFFALNQIWKALGWQVLSFRRATSQAIQSVASSQTLSRIRSSVSSTLLRASSINNSLNNGRLNDRRSIVLSAAEPFLSADVMEMMTLQDMAHVFAYAVCVNQTEFDRSGFVREIRQPAREAIEAVDVAIADSRGHGVVMLPVKAGSASDSMDALAFCAAARIFADWRNVRAVPSGYPAFAFGMGLARRDLVQNIRKIEQSVHNWLDYHHGVLLDSTKEAEQQQIKLASPTLRQLLQHEIEIKLHTKLPRLNEQSAASGLLWTKRQIQYQSFAMENNARVPIDFPSPKAAFNAAYEAVYGKYHGLLVRTVFQNTFDSAPPAKEVLLHMNLPYQMDDLETSSSKTCRTKGQDDGDDEAWVQIPFEGDDDDDCDDDTEEEAEATTVSSSSSTPYSATEQQEEHHMDFGEKVMQVFSTLFSHCVVNNQTEEERSHNSRNAMASFASLSGVLSSKDISGGSLTERNGSNSRAIISGKNDVPMYLSVIQPLENGWGRLIDDLNMNDPSRV